MCFKDFRRIMDGHRDYRTSGFCSDLKASFVEGQKFQFAVSFVSGAFRKDADGYAVFHFLYSGEYGLQTFFDIFPVQKETVEIPHPVGKKRDRLHFFFGNIACGARTEDISQKDIKKASVVADI